MPFQSSGRRRFERGGCRCCSADGATQAVEDNDGPLKVFGEKANYWELHNEITDKYDEDMMDRLNTGLDNLLIFVSAGGVLKTAG